MNITFMITSVHLMYVQQETVTHADFISKTKLSLNLRLGGYAEGTTSNLYQ